MLWVILLVLVAIGWALITSTSGQNQPSRRGQNWITRGGHSASERHLRRRVGPSTAERLIAHAQQKYPDQSRAWCADKALHDLKRDYRG